MADLEQQILAAKRLLAIDGARDDLLAFQKLRMPDPRFPDDTDYSQYEATPVANLLCDALQRVERGRLLRLAVSIPPQCGKPVWEEELIVMADGTRKRLKDVKIGDEVITHKARARRVSAIFEQGLQDCVSIETVCGRSVVAAKSHPFMTGRGWMQAGEVDCRDIVAIPRGWSAGSCGDIDEAALAGYFVGDGNCTDGMQRITCVDPAQAHDIKKCAYQMGFGISDAPSYGRKEIVLTGALPWLREIGLAGRGSHDKRVPERIMRARNEVIAYFIGAYFACDGTVQVKSGRDAKKRSAITLEFYSVSRTLLEDIRHLLARLGIRARLGKKIAKGGTNFRPGEDYVSYRLAITTQRDAYIFAKRIPVAGIKAKKIGDHDIRPNCFGNEYIQDEVANVQKVGQLPCRCLTVEEDHTFLAGDLIVHNSEIITRGFPAWLLGRKPYLNLMCGTYNQDFANDFGDEVRNIITSPIYQDIFPKTGLRTGSKAKDSMKTTRGGRISFLGRGGSGTGRPADGFIVDDPIKDDSEAQSPAIREQVWSWFNKVAFTRCHKFSFIVVVHTRWHEDDLIGRLCDPDHPDHDPIVAARWTYINIPAVVSDKELADALKLPLEKPEDPTIISEFGREPMASLWENRKPLEFLAEARRMDKRGFEALYQGNPSPDDGDYFTRDMLVPYQREELPRRLRIYGSSDHASTKNTRSDFNVLGCSGVDEHGDIWILPDLVWDKFETDRTVEEMIQLMKRHKPGLWWAENEHISQGFGPFLRKRQREEGAHITVVPVTVKKDKELIARSIQGMMSLGRVHFPAWTHWWPKAEAEMLKFPNAAHDDFVSFISMLGLGLDSETGPGKKMTSKFREVKIGTIAWIKQQSKLENRRRRLNKDDGR